MKIELKNIKIYDKLSEETTCFTADIFVNGKKIAYAKNDGRGGCTDYNLYDGKYRELLKEAEAFAETLPDILCGEFSIKQNLANFIDEEIFKAQIEKEDKAKLKTMNKAILIGVKGSYYRLIQHRSKKLSELSKDEFKQLIDFAKSRLGEGETILNTNLDQYGITL